MPLGSKSLAFLIENSSNQNSSQLADNKQKRPVLIENFEPNRARLFAPRHAPQIALTGDTRCSFAAFLPGFALRVEIDVTYSKQSTAELLPGSRIARLCSFSLRVCEGGRSPGVASWNTGRGPQSRCLNSLILHLTNCRLSGLQLFRRAGVSSNRRLREIPARCGSSGTTHLEGFICR